MFTKSKIFLLVLLSFILGVGAASFFPIISNFIPFVGLIVFLLITVIGFVNRNLRIICFCVMGFILGFWRFLLSSPVINQNHLSFYNSQEVTFTGEVISEPDARKDSTKLTIKAEKIKSPQKIEKATGRVLVNAALYPEYQYGDLLRVDCYLKTPEKIEDFSYDKYLARYDIYSVCYQPKIELLTKNRGSFLLTQIYRVKNLFLDSINKILPEPEASFLGGLLLGAKKSIPQDLMDDFNRTGVTHTVAISGYNVTIIAVLMLSVCQLIGITRKKSYWVILVTLFLFVLTTGVQSSVVRAAVMGGLILLAKRLGRLSRITNVLILTAVVMLLINPKVLVFDAGFQLSFLATVGLVYLSPLLEKFIKWLPGYFQIRESFLATGSATVFTLPLILYQFGRLSIVAIIVNILILPVIPFAMGMGFLAGMFSVVWTPLGQLFAWIVWLLLTYIIKIVETFSGFPFASLEFSNTPWIILVFGYSLLILVVRIFRQKQNRSQKVGTVSSQ